MGRSYQEQSWKRWSLIVLLLASLFWGQGMPEAIALSTPLSPQLIDNVQHFLSQETGIPPQQVALRGAESRQWANACLEAARPGEFCAEVITPGYALIVETPEGTMHLHTDRQGRVIRPETLPGVDVPPSTPVPPAAE